VEYTLEAGVYIGQAVVRDAASDQVLGERRIEYRVFPRKVEPAKGLEVISSGLSPFVLVRNEGSKVKLFQGMEAYGLGGPANAAYVEEHKVKVISTSEAIDTSKMTESWMLFWFGGAKGWDKIGRVPYAMDLPMLVVLQKMPSEIKAAGTGVEFTFPAEAGYIAMVPFYGTSLVRASQTAEWVKAFPQEVFLRCRLLAEVSREFPIKVEEQFKVQPGQDRVLVRDRFEFLSIDDDWATGHKKVAALEYGVALAQRYGFRHLNVAGKVLDLEMPVGAGAFAGIEGEECSYTLSGLLRYVNQIEQPRVIPAGQPLLAEARKNFNWNVTSLAEAATAARYVRYADPALQQTVRQGIGSAVESALDPKGLMFEYDAKAGRMLVSSEKQGAMLSNLYEVAAAGDRKLIAGHWDVIRGMYDGLVKASSWANAGLRDEAASAARLAYWAGDEETYKFACYQAAKQLMGVWTMGVAYPKWVKEKNVWAGVACAAGLQMREENGQIVIENVRDEKKGPRRVELENLAFSEMGGGNAGLVPGRVLGFDEAGDAERRFIKDRMPEYAKHFLTLEGLTKSRPDDWDWYMNVPAGERSARRQKFWEDNGGVKGHEFEILLAGIERKFGLIWQGGSAAPKADNMYRAGLSEKGRSAMVAVGGKKLMWLGPVSPQRPSGEPVGLPLGMVGE
jgi:hypothetical protein